MIRKKPTKRKRAIIDWSALLVTTANQEVTSRTVGDELNPTIGVPTVNTCRRPVDIVMDLLPKLPMLAKPIRGMTSLQDLVTITVSDDDHDDVGSLSYEIKYDGERVLAYCERGNPSSSRFYSRTLKAISPTFVLQLADNCRNAIVDGERVYVDTSTNEIVPICNTGYRRNLSQMYMLFDIQALNDEYVMHLPLDKRRQLLKSSIVPNSTVAIVEAHRVVNMEQLTSAFHDATQNKHMEGFIIKRNDSPYLSNGRSQWFKMKQLYLDNRIEVDLYAVRAKKDKNNHWAILECGYFSNDCYIFVCQVSSGISEFDKNRINLLASDASGAFAVPTLVTVVADALTANQSLRHPQFLRFCPEKETSSFLSLLQNHA